MVEVIKYNVTKDGTKVVSVGGGTYYNQGESQSGTASSEEVQQLWKNSVGSNSLIPADSSCVAEGSNSVAVGVATATSNDGELACGTYNDSHECTLFSVGDGDGADTRHNAFEVCSTGITSTNAVFDNAKVNELLDANQLEAVSAYVETLLSDQITTDYLTVTKAAHFFKLIIDEIKATQGQIIITPANAKLDKVETTANGWRCYFRSKDEQGKEISNTFEPNDQVVCQTFNAAVGTSYNVSNRFYWIVCTATGTTSTDISGQTVDCHYIDLNRYDMAASSNTPAVGDEVVQLGNRTDTTRQAAIIISAYNSEFLDKGLHAPSIVQYAGINEFNLSSHRLNVISNGLNQFKGSYNNNSGKNIETIISETASTLNGEIVTLSGTVTSHTQSISELTQTDSQLSSRISANTTSIGNLSNSVNNLSGTVQTNTTNISTLQQTSSSLTSTVSSHTQSITTISGDVRTIKSDYVTSSQLNQTASGISATVTSNIEGKLLNTGININSNKITMSSDNTEFVSASGSKTWLVGKSSNGTEIFRLGRDGDSTAQLFVKNADGNYVRVTPQSLYIEKGTASWGVTVEDGYPFMQMYHGGGNRLAVRYYNGKIQTQTGTSTTWKTFGRLNVTTVTGAYTVTDSDEFIIYKGRSDQQITLPSPSGDNTGRQLYIKDAQDATAKIYGYIRLSNDYNASWQTVLVNNGSRFFISDGEAWNEFDGD